jgi:(2Fe-2S) ferredoxin
MGKKRELRKHMRRRHGDDQSPALVICVGKSCVGREVSRALVEQTRAYALASRSPVRIEIVGCLHVCKKGPVAATWPDVDFFKRVDFVRACRLVDELGAGETPSPDPLAGAPDPR